MPGTEHWEIFGGLLVVIIALGAAAAALRRLGILRSAPQRAAPDDADQGRRIEGLEQRVQEIEVAQAHLAGQLESIPTAREFASLSKDIGKVAAEVASVRAGLDGVQTMVEGLSGQVRTLTERGLAT